MALTPGTRLGVYEITAQIGEGGMGAVYRATDTSLSRQVAIKVLPEAFAVDPDRLARLEREAKTLASLNHPHIAAIYAIEKSAGITALVMELVEGEDLSQRIAKSAITLDEALPIAMQIAEALEAAHDQGIIHRDLKPANIKVRTDGTVKILDFGLAKAMEPAGGASGGSMSPTITTPAMTQAGMILGTAAYMSPEQARGKPVDKRADIWAFGAVLFEMLTGRRAFPGEDTTDTIVSIVSKGPDWSTLPAAAPAGVRRLLDRCLKKDPKARMRDIGEARLQLAELEGAGELAPSGLASRPEATTQRWVLAAAGVTLLVGATVLATWTLTRPAPRTLPLMRLTIVPPVTNPLIIRGYNDRHFALSPDGTRLVYVSGDGQLVVRAIDRLDAVPLAGTTGARQPFFSPDGRWVGFFSGGSASSGNSGDVKKVSIAGGPPLSLCRYSGAPRGASWGPDDTIVFATNDAKNGLFRVSAAGGEPTIMTTLDPARGEAGHWFPSVLPGGRAVLFTIRMPGGIDPPQVAVLDLTTGHRTILIRGGSQPEYIDSGHLVYALDGTLRAVRFDARALTVEGEPVPVIEQVRTQLSGAAEFSASRQGALVYVPGGAAVTPVRSLVWVTRHGQETPITAPSRTYMIPRLSPDGTRVALYIGDQDQGIWIWDLARRTLTRLTVTPAFNSHPVWTPDSRRVIFASSPAGNANVFSQSADTTGTVERLSTSPNDQRPNSMTPDGTQLIVREVVPTSGADLRVLPMGGSSTAAGRRQTEPLVHTRFAEQNGDISPDGHWLAYESDDSGQFQIVVRPFPNVDGGRWTISPSGGTKPVWARSGRELFYLNGANALTVVSVHTGPTFSADTPTELFEGPYFAAGEFDRNYDVSPDGQRFLMIKYAAGGGNQADTPASMIVVVNWVEELKARVPGK